MEQYISKSAVVAEIERRKRKLLDNIICEGDKEWVVRTAHQLNRILLFLDTLEVKEVDLEKAIDDYIYTHDGRKRLALELDWKCCNLTLKGGDEIIKFAKHFFELGMQVSNKAQKGE